MGSADTGEGAIGSKPPDLIVFKGQSSDKTINRDQDGVSKLVMS
jgi:hypothetical protein